VIPTLFHPALTFAFCQANRLQHSLEVPLDLPLKLNPDTAPSSPPSRIPSLQKAMAGSTGQS
jgi:hypothetical protein